MPKIEFTAIGEILVDLIPEKPGPYIEDLALTIHFGGAPANTAIGVSRLKHRSAMVGAVGDDFFGSFLVNTLNKEGVYTKWIKVKKARTSLAFIILSKNSERRFFFYRKPWVETADSLLTFDDIDLDEILETKIIHISGAALSHPPLKDTIFYIVKNAFKQGLEISFDLNYREDLWESSEEALNAFSRYFKYSTILTLGLDELINLFKTRNHRSIAKMLLEKYNGLKYVAVRLGSKGAYVKSRREEVSKEAFKVKVVDLTGAGDSWNAGFLTFYVLEGEDLETAITYANAVAGLTCSKRGAILAFPTREELFTFLRDYM